MTAFFVPEITHNYFFNGDIRHGIRQGFEGRKTRSESRVYPDANGKQPPQVFQWKPGHIPIQLERVFWFPPIPRRYIVRGTSGQLFQIESDPFEVTRKGREKSTSFQTPYFQSLSLYLDSSFSLRSLEWKLYNVNRKLIATSVPTSLELYLFLGSSAIRDSPEHYLELIRITILPSNRHRRHGRR